MNNYDGQASQEVHVYIKQVGDGDCRLAGVLARYLLRKAISTINFVVMVGWGEMEGMYSLLLLHLY